MTALPARTDPPRETPMTQGPAPRYDVRDLLGDGARAELILDGRAYALRITRAGKLILTR